MLFNTRALLKNLALINQAKDTTWYIIKAFLHYIRLINQPEDYDRDYTFKKILKVSQAPYIEKNQIEKEIKSTISKYTHLFYDTENQKYFFLNYKINYFINKFFDDALKNINRIDENFIRSIFDFSEDNNEIDDETESYLDKIFTLKDAKAKILFQENPQLVPILSKVLELAIEIDNLEGQDFNIKELKQIKDFKYFLASQTWEQEFTPTNYEYIDTLDNFCKEDIAAQEYLL